MQRKHVYDLRQSILTGNSESTSQHIFQFVPHYHKLYGTYLSAFHIYVLARARSDAKRRKLYKKEISVGIIIIGYVAVKESTNFLIVHCSTDNQWSQ